MLIYNIYIFHSIYKNRYFSVWSSGLGRLLSSIAVQISYFSEKVTNDLAEFAHTFQSGKYTFIVSIYYKFL